jgi:hypothetical protein
MGPCSSHPFANDEDIFAVVVDSLRSADTMVMLNLARSMLREITQLVGK